MQKFFHYIGIYFLLSFLYIKTLIKTPIIIQIVPPKFQHDSYPFPLVIFSIISEHPKFPPQSIHTISHITKDIIIITIIPMILMMFLFIVQ